jgi:hypothetical protein
MTITDVTRLRTRTRVREAVSTPESERVAELRRMLDDPRWSADVKEIQDAIDYLIAKTFVADLAA